MSPTKASLFCITLALTPAPGLAGIAYLETMSCPIGGEEFTLTRTASCTRMGRTMSYRPITSCDFVTRLPVCPGNDLPVYREFRQDEFEPLEALLGSPDYDAMRDLPPWQRAYAIAQHLGEADTGTAFNLLLNALWFETAPLVESQTAMDQFVQEAEAEAARLDDADRPCLHAIAGYALSLAGRVEEANAWLNKAEAAEGTPDSLKAYLATIRACQGDMGAEGCRPDDPIRTP